MSFVIGKIAWIFLKPSNLLALAVALGLVLRVFGRRRAGRLCMGTALAGFLLCAVLPVGAWLLSPLENRFAAPELPARVDGVVVLGGAIEPGLSADRQALSLNGNAERLVAFADLARRHPAAKLVFTGGSGSLMRPDLREGDWLAPFLDAAGIARGRVVIERDSRTTHDNARLTKAVVQPQPGQVWVLVTSARHMPRAVGVFRKEGWAVLPYPVDYLTTRAVGLRVGFNLGGGLAAVDAAAYEWLGLAYYRLGGRIAAWFPAP
jgi:uncharacterized SAM-binding protein YcdF (DUF218 family)